MKDENVIENLKKYNQTRTLKILENVDETIKKVDFDVFAIGGDQMHEGFQRAIKWCEENGKEVVRLPRTPGICSSNIKNELEKGK